jgi:hypothetical protein
MHYVCTQYIMDKVMQYSEKICQYCKGAIYASYDKLITLSWGKKRVLGQCRVR